MGNFMVRQIAEGVRQDRKALDAGEEPVENRWRAHSAFAM